MRYSQFVEEVSQDSYLVSDELTPNTKRVNTEKVRQLIADAYYSGCINTYDKIKSDPRVLRNSIGFIK